jgi:peptidoglycan/xylan/chitin deacetylase (PgdA/CDA1 family)
VNSPSGGESVKISVVVPALNEETYLPPCLEGLNRQSFKGAYEIIVVDNNSRDRTADVAREMEAKVVTERHAGITWARQKGLEAARGEIVAFVDADSRARRDWLERIWTALERHPDAVAVSGNVIYERGRNFGGNLPHWFGPLVFFVDRALRWVLRKQGSLWGANFAVRKSSLVASGGFNKNLRFHGEDAELSLRLRRLGPILFDKDCMVRTSPRRFERKGVVRMVWQQFSTSVWMVVSDKGGAAVKRGGAAVKRPPRDSSRRAFVTVIILLIVLGLTSSAAYMAVSPSSQVYGKIYSTGPRNGEKVIALSFDDGPNEPYTSQVLKILDKNAVKATFFLIGENAEYYPDSVRKIVRAGHIVGNHSFSHRYRLPLEGFGGIRWEVERTEETIFRLTGLRTDLFRPPHGLRTPWFIKDIKELNYKVITWTDMTNDYDGKTTPEEIVRRIVAKAHPGGIIDLHDGKNTVHGVDRSNTVKALPVIIARLKGEGYRFITLPDLLHITPYK